MKPFFTSNPAEYTRVEGLYITEEKPPATIAGVFLNMMGVCGECIRGPIDRPVVVSGEARFKEVFGDGRQARDYGSGSGAIVGKVWQALINKPFGALAVVRAAAAGATAASRVLVDAAPANIIRVSASSPGAWPNGTLTVDVVNASDANVNHFDLVVTYNGAQIRYKNLDVTTGHDNTLAVLGTDDANWITIAKLNDGRPLNIAAAALSTLGSDGGIADNDFIAAGRGVNLLAAYGTLGGVWIAERSSAALRAQMKLLAAASNDRVFIVCPDNSGVTASTAEGLVAGETLTVGNDRLWLVFNHPQFVDPIVTTSTITCDPTSVAASILSQRAVDIHPGDADNDVLTAGIQHLTYESLVREDYALLRAAGVSGMERDDGFRFVSAVSTDGGEIVDRREKDFVQLSLAAALKFQNKKPNTIDRQNAVVGIMHDFLADLRDEQGRVVEDFAILTGSAAGNTATTRGKNLQRYKIRVRLIGHDDFLVLLTEIGTTVVITQVAA